MNVQLQSQHFSPLRMARLACVPLIAAMLLSATANAAEAKPLRVASEINVVARVNVTGTVKDAKGDPLPGVSVRIKGTNTGTTTDVNGVFRLNLPTGNETLVFTFLGFKGKEVKANGQTTINVSLEESASELDAVVVTGYGTKKRSEIIGSVATIKGEELQDIPAPNIAGALRNRVAGVSVDQVSGKPGASINLNIRNSSANSRANVNGTTEPLYIIDGITMPDSEAFDNLDPSMVETLTILKDASAAIYGAAGAKGVVLVTTKRGKVGKPSITYNGYMGVSDAAKKPEMLSGYEQALLLNDANRIANTPSSDLFSAEDLEYLKNTKIKSWYDELWQASLTQRHNLSISGGSDKITFFAGGSYQNENGNYEGLKQDKFTFRSGATANIAKGFKADVAFNVDHRLLKANNSIGLESDATFFQSIISVPQWVPISIDGKPVDFGTNPWGLLNSGYYERSKSQSYRINASLSYQPEFLKGLTAKFQISQGGTTGNGSYYKPPYDEYKFKMFGNNSLLYTNELDPNTPIATVTSSLTAETRASLSRNNSYQGFVTLQYAKTIGVHTFDLTVGGEQTESISESGQNNWTGQLVPGIDEPWAFDVTKTAQPQRTVFESSKRSFFGRFNYDIDKKYLLEAVGRLDASSNFAKGNRWGLSPSIGLGWVISKENFFKDNVPFVNFLKLRANYGITGDDRVGGTGKRLWQERYSVSTNDGYLFGTNNNMIGLNPGVYPNETITWEKKETFNVGLEASLFNSKLDVGIDVYRNHVYDGFDGGFNNIFPMYAGFAAPTLNGREVYNWGSEFTLGYRTKVAKDWNLGASMNFSFGNSVVYSEIYNPNELWINTGEDIILVGTNPRQYNSSNLGLKTLGMFRTQEQVDAFLAENPNYTIATKIPQVGWLYYEDTNKDGIINENDMVPLFKNPNPFLSTGISLNVGYKSLSLSTNILARLGGKVFYDSRARAKVSKSINVPTFWRDRWTPENPNGLMPKGDDPSIGINSDYWAVDGTMIRVNNMTLSYKVPTKVASRLGLDNARIMATGNNLWTIVNPLPFKDPYTSSSYDYPTIRTISLGLSVNF